MSPKKHQPDPEALIAALLESVEENRRWHATAVTRYSIIETQWAILLLDNGVSADELAGALGVDRTTVYRRYGKKPKALKSDED